MDAADPRVAVVMITFNRRAEALNSLGELAWLPERPEIVVVDNGSIDGTATAVAKHFPEVRLIKAGENLGAAGRTLGVQHVHAPYVAFCDDDTCWEPGSLRLAANLFDNHPRLAVLTARVLVGQESREDPTCRLMADSPVEREAGMPGAPLLGFLAGASVVRRTAFLEVGGFRPHHFLGGEEQWVAVDLAARGWWLCYAPEMVVHHYPSPQRDGIRRRGHEVRNAVWFAWLRRPVLSALRRTAALAWRRRRDLAALQDVAAALLGLPWVLGHRCVVPAAVEEGLRRLETVPPASAEGLRAGPALRPLGPRVALGPLAGRRG